MNQDRIDKIGVAAAVIYFCRMGFFNPHFNFDDKIPVWDGDIEVLKVSDSLSSEDIDFTVAVQVKSSELSNNTFPSSEKQSLKISDLKHYKEKGGTLLIKVLVGSTRTQLYFAYLGKLAINKYLDSVRNDAKTITISLTKAPNDYHDLITELRRIHIQGKHNLISAKQIDSRSDIKLSFRAGPMPKEQDPFIWMASNPVDILVQVPEFPEPFYLEEGPSYINLSRSVEHQVSVNGKVFFNADKVETSKYGCNFYIDEFLTCTLKLKENNKLIGEVKVNPNSPDIHKYITQLEFLIALNEAKKFSIGKYEFKLEQGNLSDEVIGYIKNKIRFYSDVLELFGKLNLEPNFELNKLSDSDQENLNILVKGLLHNLKFKLDNVTINQPIHIFSVAQYKIAVGIQEKDDCLQLVDIHSCRTIRKREDGKEFAVPFISFCLQHNYIADNLDFSNLIASYEAIYWEDSSEFYQLVNMDGLDLLNSYDYFQNDLQLKKAIEIFEWLCDKETEEEAYNCFFINLIQSKIRAKQKLLDTEIYKLKLLTQSEKFKFQANVLLGNTFETVMLWESLSQNQKQKFQEDPIYKIIENLISQN